ncbi:2OG-Fe dioxygenase family protein [Pseudonocardia endophytica]|uniref:2OG-Fe dioxygenase family protein n=1 Tax=Pseudonocardia endophytica TaxID=401976 RepID=UPI001404D073|nr:2OG-Fe dioxygenase family protein [Pseudonocardia endophytica]
MADSVAGDGFARFTARELSPGTTRPEFDAFRAVWEDLEPDADLADGGAYRFRRYGLVRAVSTPDGFATEPLPHRGFRQDVIPMWRDAERHFAPLSSSTLADPCLGALVAFDLTVAGQVRPSREWVVGLHAIRVVARAGESGLPTPEGVHRDGHSFVGMHLVRRENARGGESRIHRTGRPDVVFTLGSPLDSVLVDDTAVRHAVSPIVPLDPYAGRTVRDMLLVDLNPA